jgi:exodeoxyribonuclease VII small subunit
MAIARPSKNGSPNGASPDGAAPTFEERLEALENAVRDLEGEDLPLEASLQRYREGVEHLRACRALLDDAERRLAELVAEPAGGTGGEVRVTERALEVTEKGLANAEPSAERRDRAPRARKSAEGGDEIPF